MGGGRSHLDIIWIPSFPGSKSLQPATFDTLQNHAHPLSSPVSNDLNRQMLMGSTVKGENNKSKFGPSSAITRMELKTTLYSTCDVGPWRMITWLHSTSRERLRVWCLSSAGTSVSQTTCVAPATFDLNRETRQKKSRVSHQNTSHSQSIETRKNRQKLRVLQSHTQAENT